MRTSSLVWIVFASAVSAGGSAVAFAQHSREHQAHAGPTTFTIPESLVVEHRELHEELAAVSKATGPTGEAAKRVADLLHAHFLSEEEFALPPLGLLSALAADKVSADMRDVIPLTDKLRANLSRMLDEHKAIVGALDELGRTATAGSHPEVLRFVDKLKLHAAHEEQVLYPAAILVGDYVKVKAPYQNGRTDRLTITHMAMRPGDRVDVGIRPVRKAGNLSVAP